MARSRSASPRRRTLHDGFGQQHRDYAAVAQEQVHEDVNSDATEADAAGADIIHISPRLINAQLASSPTSAAGFYRPLTKTADDFDSDGYNGDDVDDDDIVLLPSYNDTPMSELATSRSHDRLLHDESLEEEPTATTVTTTSPSEFVKRHLHDRLHKSSLFEATINFTNSIVGAGIIGLPFALKQAGFGAGITLLVGLTVVVDWTIRLLVRTGKLAGHDTYQGLVAFCFGRVGLVAISVFQLVFAFGAMCAYLVIIGDTLPVVLHALINSSTGASPPNVPLSPWVEVLTGRRFIILATTFAVILPLSLLRDIGKLSKTSGAAMIALLYIIVAVMVEGPRTMWDEEGRERKPAIIAFVHPEILSAISVISFAFVCHHNSFLIFASLKRPTLDRWKMVTNLSTGISLLLSALLAVSGYLSFGGNTRGNILNNFPADNVIINVARLCFAFNIFTTYPLECFVCREVILAYVYGEAGSAGDVSTTSNKAHRLVTVTLVVTSLLISMITCDLGVVLELTGCMSATALAYILPPLCYLKLASGSIWRWEKVACMACVGVGTFIMVVSTATTVWSAMHHTSTKMCRW